MTPITDTPLARLQLLIVSWVERHIENIYAKLGMHGQAARAAAYAIRAGPRGTLIHRFRAFLDVDAAGLPCTTTRKLPAAR